MKLLKIILTDFKGFREKEIELYHKTIVEGKNTTGKSTIMDAHMWLFADRNSGLEANPDIRPNDGRECVPRVEEVWEINGKTVTIAKMQKKKVGKPDADGVSKITVSNAYEINHVPKTMRDFKKDLTEIGFVFDYFLLLSHIEQFSVMEKSDRRKILFSMSKTKTDMEIALLTDGCAEAAELLRDYRMDEIEEMHKASKKKSEDQLKAIPNQIIGKEGAKVDVDIPSLEAKKAKISQQIANLEKSLSDSSESVREADRLSESIRKLKVELNALSDKEQEKIREKRSSFEWQITEIERKKRILSDDLQSAESDLTRTEKDIETHTEALKKAQSDYTYYIGLEFDESKMREIEAEQFDDESLICPTCGQAYPEEKVQKIRDDFDKGKIARLEEQRRQQMEFKERNEKKIADITEAGNMANTGLKKEKQKKADLEEHIKKSREDISSATDEIRKLSVELSKIPQCADLSGNEEYIKIQSQIAEKESELSSLNKSGYRDEKQKELKERRTELSSVESELAKAENNRRIDEQIRKLNHDIGIYSQKKADADKILDQLVKIKRSKNELLVQDINAYFRIVRFELFEYFQNGEYKECVNILVLNEDNGEWYKIGKSANTALEMIGKMDIIAGFQKFFGKSYPVFVDSATEMDSNTMSRIQTEYQTVFLRVTDGEFEVKEIV